MCVLTVNTPGTALMERVDRGAAPPVKAATSIGQRKTEDTAEDRPDVVADPSKNKFVFTPRKRFTKRVYGHETRLPTR